MKQLLSLLIFTLFISSCNEQVKTPSVYDYSVSDINGLEFDFSTLKGKKIIIVNTASNCKFAQQLGEFEKLFAKYKNKGLEIVAFPSNDFDNLEPGTNEQIKNYCFEEYDVSYWLMSKSQVTGKDRIPIYKYLTRKNLNGLIDSEVAWNFQKYLINEEGHLVKIIAPAVSPLDSSIVNWVRR